MNMIRRIMSKEEQLRLAAIIKAERHQKLHELGHMIRGTPTFANYSQIRENSENTKGASNAERHSLSLRNLVK